MAKTYRFLTFFTTKRRQNGFDSVSTARGTARVCVYLAAFSQAWLPTVQEVLHALWQLVWHSPQPAGFFGSLSVPA
jgi:hypothetical protein